MKLQIDDGTGDPNEHAKHVDNLLDYYHAHKVVKSKLFALTLIG